MHTLLTLYTKRAKFTKKMPQALCHLHVPNKNIHAGVTRQGVMQKKDARLLDRLEENGRVHADL